MKLGVRIDLPVARIKAESAEARERAKRAALEALAQQRRRLAGDQSVRHADSGEATAQEQRS